MQATDLLSREVVVTLAILGALLVLAASTLRARLGPRWAHRLDRAGYALTLVSIALFIAAGLRAGG